MVVTDHSPCPPAMKRAEEGRFDLAWGGIASLSIALPVIWSECRSRNYSLDDLVRWMSTAPAALAGIADQAGALASGRDANFVVFDPDAAFTVKADKLHYRHPVSPYVGEKLHGALCATYLRGEAIFRDGEFLGLPQGRELALS